MNWLLAFPRLLRLPNLVMVLLTQAIPYWYILRPALLKAGGIPALSRQTFELLAAATVLTTLAGYMINDYFDRQIDAYNKPRKALIGKVIPANIWLFLYWGVLAGVTYLALRLYQAMPFGPFLWPLWVFPAVSVGLFLYAWQLKCTPIIGNLWVSVLCGLVPVILLLPEERTIALTRYQQPAAIQEAVALVWMYALFAFITNLLREQIKDMEDFHGDAACGCTTLAVAKGISYARKPAVFTGLAVSFLVGTLLYYWSQTNAPVWQIICGVVLLLVPSMLVTLLVSQATLRKHFSRASVLVKCLMLAGLFLLIRWP